MLWECHRTDATKAFATTGHSEDAFHMLNEFAMNADEEFLTGIHPLRRLDLVKPIAPSETMVFLIRIQSSIF